MTGPLLKEQLIKPRYNWKELTEKIVKELDLAYEPVGVYLIPSVHAERYEQFSEIFHVQKENLPTAKQLLLLEAPITILVFQKDQIFYL